MNNGTKTAIVALCAADKSIDATTVEKALRLLEGAGDNGDVLAIQAPLTTKEACATLRCCQRTLRNLVRRGFVRPVLLTGKRATLFSRADVLAVARGERTRHATTRRG